MPFELLPDRARTILSVAGVREAEVVENRLETALPTFASRNDDRSVLVARGPSSTSVQKCGLVGTTRSLPQSSDAWLEQHHGATEPLDADSDDVAQRHNKKNFQQLLCKITNSQIQTTRATFVDRNCVCWPNFL